MNADRNRPATELGNPHDGPDGSADGTGIESFSFELDDDLVKVVTVTRGDNTCRVTVRYGRDYLLHEQDHTFMTDAPIEIVRHSRGISIHSTRRVLGLFNRRLVQRF